MCACAAHERCVHALKLNGLEAQKLLFEVDKRMHVCTCTLHVQVQVHVHCA